MSGGLALEGRRWGTEGTVFRQGFAGKLFFLCDGRHATGKGCQLGGFKRTSVTGRVRPREEGLTHSWMALKQ